MTTRLQLHSNPYIYEYKYIYIYIYIYISLYACMYVLWHGVTLIPWPPQEPTPLRFPVWLGIPKPMIPYPLLWEGAVRTVGSHLGRIPNCSEVPDTPPPPREPREPPPPPPREPPSPAPLLDPPLQGPPPPPPRGLRPTVSWGGSWRPEPRGRPPRGGFLSLSECEKFSLNLVLSFFHCMCLKNHFLAHAASHFLE